MQTISQSVFSNFANIKKVLRSAGRKSAVSIMAGLLVSGCGAMRSYDNELSHTISKASSGQISSALLHLEEKNTSGKKDLLYYMEKGELQKLNGQFSDSRESWLLADEKVKIWEEEAKFTPENLLGNIGSVLVNDKMRRYDGQDFEKVMLSTRLALNHVLIGNFDEARTEIKKTHEREAIIAEFRAMAVARVEAESEERQVKTEVSDIRGYPVETLNDPEVILLKNSYQSAFGHYLAGFIYEALNEPSLAAPGYRMAIELRPDIVFLQEGLAGLDTRIGKRKKSETDVLFVVETGSIPARTSVSLPVPAHLRGLWVAVPISFPIIRAEKSVFLPTQLNINNQDTKIYPITNLDAMARRTLKDDMPGIILRGVIRTTAKTAAQMAVANQSQLAGLAVGLLVNATESADERGWRTLPSHILIGRTTLPAGKHTIRIEGPFGTKTETIEIAGSHAVVPIRLMGETQYVSQQYISPEIMAESMAAYLEESSSADVIAKPTMKKKPTKPNIKPIKSGVNQ